MGLWLGASALLSVAAAALGAGVLVRRSSSRMVRLGWVVSLDAVAASPLVVVPAGRFAWVHALVAVVVLAGPVFAFWRDLTQTHEPLARLGRIGAVVARWVWVIAVLDDLVVLGQFEGFWQAAWHSAPLVGTVTLLVQAVFGGLAMVALMGDGRPRLTHVRQVAVAWTSAMVVMGVGIAMGLAPGTWYGYMGRLDGLLGAMADQQVAAAILVIGGGTAWFVLGAQKMKLWLDAEESDGLRGRLTGGVRIGRSVRRQPWRGTL
jgi:hypothetical protein